VTPVAETNAALWRRATSTVAMVNPYESTAYSKGNISIRAMATVDVALRHKAAFVSATGVTATSLGLD